GLPKHLHLNQYDRQPHLPTRLSAQKPQHVSISKTYENSAGIPLLHLQPDPSPKFLSVLRPPPDATLIPVRSTTKETDSQGILQHTGISLLQTNFPPKNKFQLIPLQNLIAFEQSRQYHSATHFRQGLPGQTHLLKTNLEPFEASCGRDNKKRQKRRAEQQIKEKEGVKKQSVTFRPDDSVIISKVEKTVKTEVPE
uniref:Uncharacterized protein n=1 Tax=Sphenodon punctatus TaxID=8508 RepID=A0A8D0GI65_SPHPU